MDRSFAFWRYSGMPHFCGGSIIDMRGDGAVLTREFGPGAWYSPLLILPLQEGLNMRQELEKLEKQYRRELSRVESDFRKKVGELHPKFAKELKR